jgi:hypothetical protein
MAPEHEYFFWLRYLDKYPNLDRGLAVEIFRQGRFYEQMRASEKSSKRKTAASASGFRRARAA